LKVVSCLKIVGGARSQHIFGGAGVKNSGTLPRRQTHAKGYLSTPVEQQGNHWRHETGSASTQRTIF